MSQVRCCYEVEPVGGAGGGPQEPQTGATVPPEPPLQTDCVGIVLCLTEACIDV